MADAPKTTALKLNLETGEIFATWKADGLNFVAFLANASTNPIFDVYASKEALKPADCSHMSVQTSGGKIAVVIARNVPEAVKRLKQEFAS